MRLGLGLGFDRPQASTSTPERIETIAVQNRLLVGTESQTGDGVSIFRRYARVRTPYIIGQDSSTLIFSFNGWVQTTTGYLAMPNPFSVVEMSVEKNGVGYIPMMFDAGRTLDVQPGDLDLRANTIPASDFGLSKFSKGEIYWAKGILAIDEVGDRLPYQNQWSTGLYSGSQYGWFDPSVTTMSATDAIGAYTSTGTSVLSRTGIFCPILLGNPINDEETFGIIGDSIAAGFGDSGDFGIYGAGYFQRALAGTRDASDLIAGLNLAVGGTSANGYVGNTHVSHYYQFAKKWGENFAANDLNPSVPTTETILKNNKMALWNEFREAGANGVFSVEPACRTRSDDSWTTDIQEYYSTPWEPGEAAENIRAWLPSKLLDGSIDHIISTADVRDDINTCMFNFDGNPNTYAFDNVHWARTPNETVGSNTAITFRNF